MSPSDQRDQIARWATEHGALLARVVEELDESGGRADRPLLEQAVRRVEDRATDGVVVAYMSRFGRSTLHGLLAIQRITNAGGSFVSVQDGFDYASDTGRFVLRHMLSVAEWDLDRIRSGWRVACTRAIERGVYIAGGRPFGYRRTQAGHLEPDPVEGPIVTELFRRRADGARVPELVRFARDSGVPGPRGGKWNYRRVRRVLALRVHLGEVRWGTVVNEAAHPPLVDGATWGRAQQAVPTIPRRRGREPALLRGFLRCGGCQRLLATTTKRPGTSEEARLYFCRGYSSAAECSAPAAVLDSIVEPYVERLLWQELRYARVAPARREFQRLRQQLERRESELASYRDNPRITAAIGPERFAEGLAIRAGHAERARLALARLDQSRVVEKELPSVAELRHKWRHMSLAERRAVIGQVFACAFLERGQRRIAGRLRIYRHGRGPTYPLPGYERRVRRLGPFDPTSCGPPARPRKPQEPWDLARIEATLRPFIDGRDIWPSFGEFQHAGLALLHAELQRRGRATGWAAEFGVHFEGPRRFERRWTDAEIRTQLRAYLNGKSTWPAWSQFATDSMEPLRLAVRWSGGPERWASELGVELPPCRHSGAYWTTARITRELAEFANGRSDWPARSEFKSAGRLKLYRMISERKLRKHLASQLHLTLPPGKTKIVRPRWTEASIVAALDEVLAGRKQWPKACEMSRAGLGGLDQLLVRERTHNAWARRYGVRPRPGLEAANRGARTSPKRLKQPAAKR